VTPAAAANPKNVRIDFGDGSDPIDMGAVTSATTITKRYSSPGQYTVRVTQENVNGTSSTAVVVVTATAV
jgi:PKD repeat protein